MHSESVPYADICTKYVQLTQFDGYVLFVVRIGAYFELEPLFSTVAYIAVQKIVSRDACSCCCFHIEVHDTGIQYLSSLIILREVNRDHRRAQHKTEMRGHQAKSLGSLREGKIRKSAERSEKPGCEVWERSEYRETGRSGKVSSEARDRRKRCNEESILIIFE